MLGICLNFRFRFCYTDEFGEDDHGRLTGIFHLADKYQVDSMKSKCTTVIKEKISAENAVFLYGISCKYNFPTLKTDLLTFISENATKCFQSSAFLDQEYEVIDSLTAKSEINITESFLLQRVLDWAIEECKRKGIDDSSENVRNALGHILQNVRFMSIPDDVFEDNALVQTVLQKEEMAEISRLYQCSKTNEPLASDTFPTMPRKGHKYSSVPERETYLPSTFSYDDMIAHEMCFEVSGPLWLHGVVVYREYIEHRFIGVRILLQTEGQTIQCVEIYRWMSYKNPLNIIFQDPIRVTRDKKYTLRLVLFCSAKDRDMYYQTEGIERTTFCEETVSFATSFKAGQMTSIVHFGALLLEGLKWRYFYF